MKQESIVRPCKAGFGDWWRDSIKQSIDQLAWTFPLFFPGLHTQLRKEPHVVPEWGRTVGLGKGKMARPSLFFCLSQVPTGCWARCLPRAQEPRPGCTRCSSTSWSAGPPGKTCGGSLGWSLVWTAVSTCHEASPLNQVFCLFQHLYFEKTLLWSKTHSLKIFMT